MRTIKFRGWGHFGSNDKDEMISGWEDSSYVEYIGFDGGDWFEIMQFTGLLDKNGVEIFEGDILNICFTSDSGEFIHDGIFTTRIDILDGINFRFNKLFWENHGHNQYPIIVDLNCRNKMGLIYSDEKERHLLYTSDQYKPEVEKHNSYPFNNEKSLSFSSRYFEVIGNIYEHKHLLEDSK